MSYEVLARKWRPHGFAELVGQEHVVQALSNALDQDRLHHAYLFTGTRGVGKTTLARIFAKSLNCEEGVSSTPCGVCSTCREVDEGRFVDLLEVDAASRTKVEQTRELLENVPYAPAKGRYKVYLIDEVHMFSDSSFNALLKTLEEPPPHVKFLLATTDPQKLPMTVLSRCLQFGLKRLTLEQIAGQLRHILDVEKVGHDDTAVTLLAYGADGSMRDGLSLLDQAINFGGGEVVEEKVASMLGTVSRDYVFGLVEALVARDGKLLMQKIDALADRSPDFRSVLDELLRMLHRVAVLQTVPDLNVENEVDHERYAWMVETVPADEVQLYYQIGITGKRDMPMAPDLRSGFEMVMLRMLAFQPGAVSQPAEAPRQAQKKSPEPVAAPAARPAEAATEAEAETKKKVQQQAVPAAPVSQDAELPQSVDWNQLQKELKLGGISGQLAMNCAFDSVDGNLFRLVLPEEHQALQSDMAVKRMEEELRKHFGCAALKLEIALGKPQVDTPAQRKLRLENQRLAEAKADMVNDPFVKELQQQLGARVIDETIKPV
ncbi:DNA polymerase III, subunit gamma and tau [Solemya velum gill symbiont]|uniref:DNA polymerase III subunit gamma/tau n=1 Tax=Solemya velum gill symbiont TaxID=2340 RepID=UPI0009978A44|nr:DNA polymerase III subunit gamma/tau [Solemya velum gill symbiont]OOZ18190.1 DNA polymerase III, subunit gamma and tau [Solemya velum gill symbiont]OOZ27701.1 DNA polymerase III, subunit gamma and tau [Solemya velum gill symbiont]